MPKVSRKQKKIIEDMEVPVFTEKSHGILRNRRVLVINANYQPITTTTLTRAIIKIFKGNAIIVLPPSSDAETWQEMTWDDWSKLKPKEGETTLNSVSKAFKIPEIIKCVNFGDTLERKVKLSRRAIFKRDNFQCQYCGKKPDLDACSLDHIIPRCLGGITSWQNVVLSCLECNTKKGSKTLDECNFKLLKEPKPPEYDITQGRLIRVDSWSAFLGEAYWNVPLKD